MNVSDCKIISLPKILDIRGNLSFIEGCNHIPCEIKRTFWIYDVPGGEERGGHAYKETEEFIIALSGSFDVILNDGENEERFHLNRSYYGLFVPKMMWRQMVNFSTNSLALVLSSTYYDQNDYVYDFNIYKQLSIEQLNNSTTQQSVVENKLSSASTHRRLNYSTVFDCTILEFNKHTHDKGNLTVIENSKTIPFDVKRIYYLYDIPGGEERGGHAHKELKQLIIAASGSFDVVLNDGKVKRTVALNRPYQGLLVVPGLWRELNNFSSGAICLVLASERYDEKDYIRDYREYSEYKK